MYHVNIQFSICLNYQDCHIFQRDKSQTSGADKVPAQQIQTPGPQLSLGAESSTAPTRGRSTSGTASRTPSSALAGREENKFGGPTGGPIGGPKLVGQTGASPVVQLVGHLWWAIPGGPKLVVRGGPFLVGQSWL